MLEYTLRRIAYTIPIGLAVSIVCFLLVHISPGDPIDAIVPPDTSTEIIEQIRAEYGLDRPLPVQYGLWLAKAVQGDFGNSIAKGRPIGPDLWVATKNSLLLALLGATLGFVVGSVLGGIAGAWRDTWIDKICLGIAIFGVSVPHYWLGMVLVIVFSVHLNLLPSMGMGPGGPWAWDWENLRFMVLPVITLSVIPAGLVTRTVRGLVSDIMGQDYVTTLRGKGLRRSGIVLHVVKNAAPTTLAVMGLQLASLLGGSILVEAVFAWPGTGMLLNNAIFQRDLPVLQATTLVLAFFFVVLNLIVDLLQTALDPRMRRS
jgi:peptide/nickel transport system permease protein